MSYVRSLGSTQSRPVSGRRTAMGGVDTWYVHYDAQGWINRSGVTDGDPPAGDGFKVFANEADFIAALAANKAKADAAGFALIPLPEVSGGGMSTGAKVAIGAGVLGALYFITRGL